MVVFWIAASAMIAAALAFVLPPLVGRGRAHDGSRAALNLAIYRERRHELEAEHAAGTLDDGQLAEACAELDRELLRDVDGAGEDAPGAPGAARSPYPAIVLAVLLPLAAFGLYLELGTPQVLVQPESVVPQAQAGGVQGMPHSLEEIVARLEQRMREQPDDPQGWLMLGRSYAAMNRLEPAREALLEADRRNPGDPLTLVALAEVLASLQGNTLQGEPIALVRRALELDPAFARGLWLAGVHAFNQGDREQARSLWQRLLATPDLSPEAAEQVRQAVAEAGGAAPAPPAAAAAATPAPAAQAIALTVNVSLSPALAGRMSGGETLFVYARAAQGPRMPLAIARHRASDLPVTVTLDESMAMMPQMTLAAFEQVVVSARVSRSGSATPASGDLQGESAPLSPRGAGPVNVLIDTVLE